MLRFRLLSAAIVISTALVFVAADANFDPLGCSGVWMLPVGAYLIFGSAIECASMARSRPEYEAGRLPALIGCGGVMIAAVIPVFWPALQGEPYPKNCLLGELGWPLVAMLVALLASFAWFLPSYEQGKGVLAQAMFSGWVACYFGGCFAFAVALRMVGESAWGLYLLVGIIVCTKFADAGAYFVGRTLGKTKLCPQVSPGKTVEGLVGGALIAILVSWIYFRWCGQIVFDGQVHSTLIGIACLGGLLTVSGLVGDLVASIFKREMGCKDSGQLLPGLGGLWDVSDSLLPSFVVAYVCVVAELIQGPGQ